MEKKLTSFKESMKALKNMTEEEAAQIIAEPSQPEINAAKKEGEALEEDDEVIPTNDEILKKIEVATEELDKELDNQKLSDDLKESVKRLLKLKEEEIRSDLEKEYSDKQDEFENNLVDQTDDYLNKVAEEWLEENKMALKESIQVSRVQNFVQGFKKLLEENNIELPADSEAEIQKYKDENDELKDELNKEMTESFKLRKLLKESRKLVLVEKKISALNLAMSEADKFRKICEEVEFDDEDQFNKDMDKEVKEIEAAEVETPKEDETPKAETLEEKIARFRK